MKQHRRSAIWPVLAALAVSLFTGTVAAEKNKPDLNLSRTGERLYKNYFRMLDSLKDEVVKSMPEIDKAHAANFMSGYEPEGDIPSGAKALLTDLKGFLSSNQLDAKLARAAVLADAAGLARFAEGGREEQDVIEKLLANDQLMIRLLVEGDQDLGGRFGEAAQAYDAILKASPRASEGMFNRLALGVAMAREYKGQVNDFDPVARYLSYEKAYLEGELDPLFNTLTAWEYEKVVNADATDEDLAWGRAMLRTYRPDHILEDDYRWRYVKIVRTDVPYQSPEDLDSTQFPGHQRFICAGGKCGPRAFFGRFILRAFGIPTWGVTQKGHAALGHWTPDGWTTCFGAHWRSNWWANQSGLDFLLDSQARKHPEDYMMAKRAEWIGRMLGEPRSDVQRNAKPENFWGMLAIFEKKRIVAEKKPREVASVGEDLAESNVSTKAEEIANTKVPAADSRISEKDGLVVIPAVATSHPKENTGQILFMKSFGGGMQLHHHGGKQRGSDSTEPDFEYKVSVPFSGTYDLVARVALVTLNQQLTLTVKDSPELIEIELPYTAGLWKDLPPVQIRLARGNNTLSFSRNTPNRGLSIRQFTLAPTGSARPSVSSASSSSRPARTLGLGQQIKLDELLHRSLAELSHQGMLKPLPMNISKARSKVWLEKVQSDGRLTFHAMAGDGQASFNLIDLPQDDRALLSRLVARLNPEDKEAQAVAGIYMEVTGHTDSADGYYMKAGPDFRDKIDSLFE